MKKIFLSLLLVLGLSGCSHGGGDDSTPQVGIYKVGRPYQVQGRWYTPEESYTYDETGIASWYGPGFHNKKTANGERYNQRELTAAHRTLQLPSFVRVTNLDNGRSVVVRVNDRGPFAKSRIIDVSEKAAELLDFKRNGTGRVRVQVLPEASRQLAEAARQGRSWSGDIPNEVLSNSSPVTPTLVKNDPAPRPYELGGQPVAAHQVGDAYYPDLVVTQQAVPASTQLYIQAGSFGQAENAQRLVQQLGSYGRAYVSDKGSYHRVRMGPYKNLSEASAMLGKIGTMAPEARIIVE